MQANWLRAVLVTSILLIAGPVQGEDFRITGIAAVIDGDTIEIRGIRIRLFGIDAPEGAQDCGRADGTRWDCAQRATSALENYLRNRPVVCVRRDVDRYGRLVGQCTVSGVDVNAWLVRNGWAVAYTRYSRDYVRQEAEARAARRGIWSGDFVMPWEWRRGQRPLRTNVHSGGD
jgi:endonuclease YncB( thermonuclease family)